MRRFFKFLVIILVSALVALLLCEGVLRLLAGGAYQFRRTYTFDEYTGYDTKKNIDIAIGVRGEYRNVVHVNSKGLVGGEVPYDKPHGTYRLLVVGDSFTAGGPVPFESLFTEVLERKLGNISSGRIEVLSKGVTSWSLEPEVAFLEHEGVKYQPDMVVIAMFNPQDVWYDYHRGIYELKNGTLRENRQVPRPFPVEEFKKLCSESELCSLLQLYYYMPSDVPAKDELYWLIYKQSPGGRLQGGRDGCFHR